MGKPMRLRLLTVTVAAVLLLSTVALAATDTGTFKGTTSQHLPLRLRIYKKNSRTFADRTFADLTIKLRFKCPSRSMTQATGFNTFVTRHGKRYFVFAGGGPYDFRSHWSWIISGKKLSGSGNASFDMSGGKCRSGKVTFSAKR